VLHVRRGSKVQLVIEIELPGGPNWAQFTPSLAASTSSRATSRQGRRQGTLRRAEDQGVKSFEVGKSADSVKLVYDLGEVDKPVYVRLRGTDGNRFAPARAAPRSTPTVR